MPGSEIVMDNGNEHNPPDRKHKAVSQNMDRREFLGLGSRIVGLGLLGLAGGWLARRNGIALHQFCRKGDCAGCSVSDFCTGEPDGG